MGEGKDPPTFESGGHVFLLPRFLRPFRQNPNAFCIFAVGSRGRQGICARAAVATSQTFLDSLAPAGGHLGNAPGNPTACVYVAGPTDAVKYDWQTFK